MEKPPSDTTPVTPAVASGPEHFHGARAKPPFFEGWYFKLSASDTSHALAIIVGISLPDSTSQPSQAFIEVLDGRANKASFHSYPTSQFSASTKEPFFIRCGPNVFTKRGIELLIPGRITGAVTFDEESMTPWAGSGNAMGWTRWVPGLECYHAVLSFDHRLKAGKFQLDGDVTWLDFTNGRGYWEKDWGTGFPNTWMWMQCNSFPNAKERASVFGAFARTKYFGITFPAFMLGFLHGDTEYHWCSYDLESSTIARRVTPRHVEWSLKNKRSGIVISINIVRGPTSTLPGPGNDGGMSRRVPESLSSLARVLVMKVSPDPKSHKEDFEVLFDQSGNSAGLEVFGDLEKTLREELPLWKRCVWRLLVFFGEWCHPSESKRCPSSSQVVNSASEKEPLLKARCLESV